MMKRARQSATSVDSQKSLGLRLNPHTEKGWCYTAHGAVQQLSQDDHVNADIQGYFGKPCWRMDMPMLIVLRHNSSTNAKDYIINATS
jgi:hypothetical protein